MLEACSLPIPSPTEIRSQGKPFKSNRSRDVREGLNLQCLLPEGERSVAGLSALRTIAGN